MTYYDYKGRVCCSSLDDLPFHKIEAPTRCNELFYLFRREPSSCRASFAPTCAGQLFAEAESCAFLNSNALPRTQPDALLGRMLALGRVRAVNSAHPRFEELMSTVASPSKYRVNILAIGDVGSNMLTGLRLLGGDVISRIGICDLNPNVVQRWVIEENQIAYPWDYDALPDVVAVEPDNIFDCDVFVFAASKGIPPVGSGIKDVRMAQFETNRTIAAHYARLAREKHYQGLYIQLSDPIDPLAKVAYLESNRNENGIWDGKGLLPEQIQGFGLGVMNARAAYYAKQTPLYSRFLTEGRTYGPHGHGLIIADSVEHYSDEISRELTQKVETANLEVRALGFKPFVAPAMSSGALNLLLTLRGEWHHGSLFLGGSFMGCKTRCTSMGIEAECLPMPNELFVRLQSAEKDLASII